MSPSTSRELEPDHSCLCRWLPCTLSGLEEAFLTTQGPRKGAREETVPGTSPRVSPESLLAWTSLYPSTASSHSSATLPHSQLRTWSKTGNLWSSLQSGRWAEETSLTATWKTVSVWV